MTIAATPISVDPFCPFLTESQFVNDSLWAHGGPLVTPERLDGVKPLSSKILRSWIGGLMPATACLEDGGHRRAQRWPCANAAQGWGLPRAGLDDDRSESVVNH